MPKGPTPTPRAPLPQHFNKDPPCRSIRRADHLPFKTTGGVGAAPLGGEEGSEEQVNPLPSGGVDPRKEGHPQGQAEAVAAPDPS